MKPLIEKRESTSLDRFEKMEKNLKESEEIRGEIIMSIINLDDLLELIILKKYIKEELWTEFEKNMFNDESCSTSLKYRVVARSGLLDKYDGLKKNIQTLIEIRNSMAHSKNESIIQTVEILHKKHVKDIQSLKEEFDSIFEDTASKLREALLSIDDNIAQ